MEYLPKLALNSIAQYLQTALFALLTFFCFAIAVIVIWDLCLGLISFRHPAPGPFLARFTRLWYFYQVSRHDWHKTTKKLHRKYGPVFRMYPGCFSIDDPAAMVIYSQGNHFKKSEFYIAMSNPMPEWPQNIFAERDVKKHAESRRKIASLYTMTSLVKMEKNVDETISLFKERLIEAEKEGRVIDMQFWLQCFAFDTVGVITVSKRFGFLDKCEDIANIFPVMRDFLSRGNYIGVYPWTHVPIFKLSMWLGGNARSFIQDFTVAQINSQMSSDTFTKSENTLARLLTMHKEKKLTMMEVFNVCSSNVGAGSDTTSISLAAVLWYLTKSPSAKKKLLDELEQGLAKGEVSRPITFLEAQRLPYLQATIKEALRLHPAFAMTMGREVPVGGIELAGMYFPEGTVVGINSWAAHYNRDVFGKDADEFRPERWLGDKEAVRKMEEYNLTFGSGSRTCIGKNISLMQISKLVPELLLHFDFKLKDPDAELETFMAQFVWQTNFFCTVTSRT